MVKYQSTVWFSSLRLAPANLCKCDDGEDAASALLLLSAVMELLEFGRKIVDTILRDAVWLLLLCRESCDPF